MFFFKQRFASANRLEIFFFKIWKTEYLIFHTHFQALKNIKTRFSKPIWNKLYFALFWSNNAKNGGWGRTPSFECIKNFFVGFSRTKVTQMQLNQLIYFYCWCKAQKAHFVLERAIFLFCLKNVFFYVGKYNNTFYFVFFLFKSPIFFSLSHWTFCFFFLLSVSESNFFFYDRPFDRRQTKNTTDRSTGWCFHVGYWKVGKEHQSAPSFFRSDLD